MGAISHPDLHLNDHSLDHSARSQTSPDSCRGAKLEPSRQLLAKATGLYQYPHQHTDDINELVECRATTGMGTVYAWVTRHGGTRHRCDGLWRPPMANVPHDTGDSGGAAISKVRGSVEATTSDRD